MIALETDSESLAGLLSAVAGAYVLGAPVRPAALFADRFTRPLPLDKEFQFFASPCETAPADVAGRRTPRPDRLPSRPFRPAPGKPGSRAEDHPGAHWTSCAGWPPSGPSCRWIRCCPTANPLDELHLSAR